MCDTFRRWPLTLDQTSIEQIRTLKLCCSPPLQNTSRFIARMVNKLIASGKRQVKEVNGQEEDKYGSTCGKGWPSMFFNKVTSAPLRAEI